MTTQIRKSTVTFIRPFILDGFEGMLPEGTYNLESEHEILDGMSLADCLRTSVLIRMQPKLGSPALAQTLTVPWESLERALTRDESVVPVPSDLLLDDMLADPVVRLIMLSDGVSEIKVRSVVKLARELNSLELGRVDHSKSARLPCSSSQSRTRWIARRDREKIDWRATDRGENEGMALIPA